MCVCVLVCVCVHVRKREERGKVRKEDWKKKKVLERTGVDLSAMSKFVFHSVGYSYNSALLGSVNRS